MPAPKISSKGCILIAEDIQVIAIKMSAGLRQAGYEVHVAVDGEQCLEKARAIEPDLILLDIMMPKMHGVEVIEKLRADPKMKNIGVIVCSAKDFGTEQIKMTEMGAYDFLVKPLETSELVSKVNGFFGWRSKPGSTTPLRESTGFTEKLFRPTLQTKNACLTLWGSRGSTPTPGATFLRHGGQTSCMTIVRGDTVLIFDAGSGIRDLGQLLAKSGARNLHLFITHTHWDHIQGFPFFVPAYVPGFNITVYGARGFGKDLKSVFSGQLDRDYFPVQIEDMKAKLDFVQLGQEPIVVDGIKITWEFSNHPGATVGYKIDLGEVKVAWVPDNEFLKGYTGSPDDITRENELVAPHLKMVEFLTGVDVVFHEAQFTNEEYPKRIGWGHSGLSNACLLICLAKVPRWIITHHDPLHDDHFLEGKLNLTRQLLERLGHVIPVVHGYDGMTEYL